MELRYYQQEAIEGAEHFIKHQFNPVIVLPTGAGKSLVLAGIIEKHIMEHPKQKILVLSHVKEILEQDYSAIVDWVGDIVGVYSAGLGEKQLHYPVTVASIQTIHNLDNTTFFSTVGLIIIDECHLVNHQDVGMYRSVIRRCNCSVVGLTATPFRLGHGYIYQGDDTVFDTLGYDGGNFENYNRLVQEGHLSRIISKSTSLQLDLSEVRTVAGDYNSADLSSVVDQNSITESAVNETIKYGKNYKKWLIFAIDIAHAEHIRDCLLLKGIPTGVVHSKMDIDRSIEIAKFKLGKYRAMVNVDVLTTGFNVPDIDLIVMLRPTKSHTIHVQTAGRGARVANGKTHCLFLDFAGNTERLGPINDVKINQPKSKKGKGGTAITKTCPECGVIHHPSVKSCDVCGFIFEFKTKLQQSASITPIVKEITPRLDQWLDVSYVTYSRHLGRDGKSDSMRVQYHCGLNSFSEWIAYGRQNYGGHLAKNWVRWRWRTGEELPASLNELLEKTDLIATPKRVHVDMSGKFPKILDAEF
jgi:DNA repair protein RadD